MCMITDVNQTYCRSHRLAGLLFYISLKNSPCSSTIVWNKQCTVWFAAFYYIINPKFMEIRIGYLNSLNIKMCIGNSPVNNTGDHRKPKKELSSSFTFSLRNSPPPGTTVFHVLYTEGSAGVTVIYTEFHWYHKHVQTCALLRSCAVGISTFLLFTPP